MVPAGSTVYLYTQSTTDATTTVPDATGKTGTFAAQMLKASGVNGNFGQCIGPCCQPGY